MGDAMVGNLGMSELFNYTVVGDTVNLSQRLEVAAQPGLVLIAPANWFVRSDKNQY